MRIGSPIWHMMMGGGENPILFRYSAGDSIAGLGGTFTRASTGTYRDVNGVLQSAASGVLRDAHYELDPVSGLYVRTTLLEGQRTNLCQRSEENGTAPWVRADTSITNNATTAPNGTLTADLATEGSAGTAENYQPVTVSSGATVAYSVYLKRGNTDWMRIVLGFGANNAIAWVNLGTGVVGAATNAGTATGASIAMEPAANGFYRVTITGAVPGNTVYNCQVNSASANSSNTRVSGATYYIWGGNAEAAAFASSYTPTPISATVSRAGDTLSFPIGFNPQELSIFTRHIELGSARTSASAIYSLGSSTSANAKILGMYAGGGGNGTQVSYHSALLTSALTVVARELVESRVTMNSSGNLTQFTSRNAGTETGSTATVGPAVEATWANNVLLLNEYNGTKGFAAFRDIIIAKGIRELAYFRALVSP